MGLQKYELKNSWSGTIPPINRFKKSVFDYKDIFKDTFSKNLYKSMMKSGDNATFYIHRQYPSA